MEKERIIAEFKKQFEGVEITKDLKNEFFTNLFYDLEDEQDLEAMNEAEKEIERIYNL